MFQVLLETLGVSQWRQQLVFVVLLFVLFEYFVSLIFSELDFDRTVQLE
jgi:hypothetical protein